MGILLVNHFMLAGSQEKSEQILEEARELFSRVKTEAEDPNLGKEAVSYTHLSSLLCSISIPILRKQEMVERQSAPSRK